MCQGSAFIKMDAIAFRPSCRTGSAINTMTAHVSCTAHWTLTSSLGLCHQSTPRFNTMTAPMMLMLVKFACCFDASWCTQTSVLGHIYQRTRTLGRQICTLRMSTGRKCLEESKRRPLCANLGVSQIAVALTVYIML